MSFRRQGHDQGRRGEEKLSALANPWSPLGARGGRREPRPGTFWRCPTCGYCLTDAVMVQARQDFGCTRCGTPFWKFTMETLAQGPRPAKRGEK